MDEATLERRLHLNMTLIGGFMVGYGVINRHDILGSAQTGNMVSLAMDAVGHADEEWFFRIIALIIYVASVSLTVILSHKISKMSQKMTQYSDRWSCFADHWFLSGGNESICCSVSNLFGYSFSVVFI